MHVNLFSNYYLSPFSDSYDIINRALWEYNEIIEEGVSVRIVHKSTQLISCKSIWNAPGSD